MPRPRPLPPELPERFTVAQARELGVPHARLGRSDLTAPFHGVRESVERDPPTTAIARCVQYLPRLAPHQFFSHETALDCYGVPMPEWPYAPGIHVSTHRPAREPRTRGVTGHRLQVRQPLVRLVSGLRLEDPVRAWRQCAGLWLLDDLIVAADAMLSGDRPLATFDELAAEIQEMGDSRGGVLARALREVRGRVRSPRETRLRLALVRAGLPEPEISWNLFDRDGTFIAELDLAYPEWSIGIEYDGRVHAVDERQFARDADRWAAIRRTGWAHVRCLNHHMRDGAVAAVELVREALLVSGWRPGLS
jgi:hypothetical protein